LLCSECGLDYNLIFHRPVEQNVCDVCGGKLIRRIDDNEASIRSRLKDYHEKTSPILDLFSKKELVIRVDGTRNPDEVQREIRNKLNL
jgi:adenylate kinase